MGKIGHTELVYREICTKELKRKYANKPEEIEKILFLMQYEALKNNEKSIYKYKTYIDGSNIRIKYLSDLLRVMPLTDIAIGETSVNYTDKKNMQRNREKTREYTNLSDEKLNELINWVLAEEKLSSKYFVLGKYNNKIMRLLARFQNWYINHNALIGYLFISLTMFFVAMIIASVVLIPVFISLGKEYASQTEIAIKGLLLIITITSILWLTSTIKITKPTEYEKENHHDI